VSSVAESFLFDPTNARNQQQPIEELGELAQLGERLVCNQEVTGSSPVFSTSLSLTLANERVSYGWQARRRLSAEAQSAKVDVAGQRALRERKA
jgi:hypothetical protein